jgi:hypothetical protein
MRVDRSRRRPRRAPTGLPPGATIHRAESLESRTLLTIVVNGTDNADTLVVDRVGNDLHVTLNGDASTIHIGGESQLRVNGLGGNDTIRVSDIMNSDSVVFGTVDGGDGNDTITVGRLDRTATRVDGGAGTDTVVLDDTGAAGNRRYDLRGDVFDGGLDVFIDAADFPSIHLDDDVQTVRLIANELNNIIEIRDGSTQINAYEVRGGDGDDTCAYENGGARVDFDGGSGTDTFRHDATHTPDLDNSVVIDTNSMTRGGETRASWSNTQAVDLTLKPSPETVSVVGVGAGINVTVRGGLGDDVFTVGDGDLTANIRGRLNVRGDGGTDRISLVDSAGAVTGPDDAYTLDDNGMTKTGTSEIVFFVENRLLLCNGENNTVTLEDDSLNNSVTVNGGGGDDVITLAISSSISSDFALNGGAGNDTIVFVESDSGFSVDDKDYQFSGGALQYFADGELDSNHSYAAETVTLNAGRFDSTISVVSLANATTLNVNGGGGNDTLALAVAAVPAAATVSFNGQDGADAIVVDDRDSPRTTGVTYTLEKTTFDMTGFGLLAFATTESMELSLRDGFATVDVNGIAAGAFVSIRGGFDPDTFNVGDGDIDTNLSGSLSIQGNQGGDRLVLDDTADTGNDGYALANGVFSKSNVAVTVTYGTLEFVEVNGSAGNNTFTFESPGFATDVDLRGFAGSDTFVVTPSTRATVTVEGSDPTVAPGDVLRFVSAAPAGAATLTPNGPVNGTYTFAAAEPVIFTGIETFTPPPAAPGAPDLSAAHDTGTSSTDNVTRITTPSFGGTGPVGQRIELRDAGATLGSATASEPGAYAINATFPADGVYAVQAFALDPASGLTGAASPVLNVTIDTVAPAPPAAAPDLLAASDTGTSNTDNLTRDDTPQLVGQVPSGVVVRLFSGATELGVDTDTASGSYDVTTAALPDGVTIMVARFTDLAGNFSGPGPSLPVTIDTLAPRPTSMSFDPVADLLRYTFSEDVGASLSEADLSVISSPGGLTVPDRSVELAYAPNVARFTFPGFAAGRLPAGGYRAALSNADVTDAAGNPLAGNTGIAFDAFAAILARALFVGAARPGTMDANKVPLLPGQAASFANVATASGGIDGVTIDVAGLPTDAAPAVADFVLETGDGSTWTRLAGTPTVTLSRGAGASRSDRLTVRLPAAIANCWLRITTRTGIRTGLAGADVFHFGTLPGDTGGVVGGALVINVTDLALTRSAVGRTDPAALAAYDFSRDGGINAADVLIVRNNQRRTLALFSVAPVTATSGMNAAPPPARGPLRLARRTALGFAMFVLA